jgi:hypothetical protein
VHSKAADLWSDWSIEDIELDDPQTGEVKVKLAAFYVGEVRPSCGTSGPAAAASRMA